MYLRFENKPLPLSTAATPPLREFSMQFSCSITSSVQLPVVLITAAITYCPVVAKSAVSYKFNAVCGFFAAVCVMIFRVIDWQVCGVRWQ